MAWSGMTGILLTGALADALNVPQDSGFLIQKIAANSPASRIGLKPSRVPASIAGQELFIGGDIILSVGGMAVSPNMTDEFREAISRGSESGEISLRVLREGNVIVFRAPL